MFITFLFIIVYYLYFSPKCFDHLFFLLQLILYLILLFLVPLFTLPLFLLLIFR